MMNIFPQKDSQPGREFFFSNPQDDSEMYAKLPMGFQYDISGKVMASPTAQSNLAKPKKRCANCTCGKVQGDSCKMQKK